MLPFNLTTELLELIVIIVIALIAVTMGVTITIKEKKRRERYNKYITTVLTKLKSYFPNELNTKQELNNDFKKIYQSYKEKGVTIGLELNGVKIYANPLYMHSMKKKNNNLIPDLSIIIHQKLPRVFNEEIRTQDYEVKSKEVLLSDLKKIRNESASKIPLIGLSFKILNTIVDIIEQNMNSLDYITIINKKIIQNQDNPETLANELYYTLNTIKKYLKAPAPGK